MHPEKTKIIYCSSKGKVNKQYEYRSFDFLGYTFRRRSAVDPKGVHFCSYLPAISDKSKKAIKEEIRGIKILQKVQENLGDIAKQLNPKIRGWFNYYGKFTKSEMSCIEYYIDCHLRKWLQKKFKKLRKNPGKAQSFLNNLRKNSPKLFAHWNASTR